MGIIQSTLRREKSYLEAFDRANEKRQSGDYPGAIEDYNQALQLNPDFPAGFKNRGIAKSELGDYRGAMEDFNEALRLKPNYVEVFNNRAIAKINLGDYRGAINDCDRALDLRPNIPEAFHHRAIAKSELENYCGAIEDHYRALRLGLNISGIFIGLGWAMEQLKEPRYAEHYQKALKVNSEIALACLEQAQNIYRASQREKDEIQQRLLKNAKKYYQICLQLDPENQLAKEGLVTLKRASVSPMEAALKQFGLLGSGSDEAASFTKDAISMSDFAAGAVISTENGGSIEDSHAENVLRKRH